MSNETPGTPGLMRRGDGHRLKLVERCGGAGRFHGSLITDQIGLQVTGDGLQDIFHGSMWQRTTINVLCEFQGGQDVQGGAALNEQ
jgi:hypothetical protein